MSVCFALALMAFRCCGSCLVENVKEYISLSLPGTGVDGFVMQAPEILAHPYASCLILLISNVGILWGLWDLVSP